MGISRLFGFKANSLKMTMVQTRQQVGWLQFTFYILFWSETTATFYELGQDGRENRSLKDGYAAF